MLIFQLYYERHCFCDYCFNFLDSYSLNRNEIYMGIINYIKDKWRGSELGGIKRSSKWSSVRKQYLKLNPNCAVCGKENRFLKSNEIHHCIPIFWDKSLELQESNLITLCPEHHFLFGHLMDWKSFAKDVRIDSEIWKKKIQDRPKKNVISVINL